MDLATRAVDLLAKSGTYRVVIVLVGAPGSGKSTVAQRVVGLLNQRHRDQGHCRDDVMPTMPTLRNTRLPAHDIHRSIDLEDEHYTPTREDIDDGVMLRGRGGDETAIKINKSAVNSDHYAQVIPSDGFHLPRSVLSQFKDPVLASQRRGAPTTFDSSLVVALVENLKATLEVPSSLPPLDTTIHSGLPEIHIPSFDHKEKDPRQFGILIHPSSRILIMEGLYLLLNNPVWEEIPRMLNPQVEVIDEPLRWDASLLTDLSKIPVPEGKNHEFWTILVDDEKILSRLGNRHLNAGIVSTLKEGEERVRMNDLQNGKKIYTEGFKNDITIISIDDVNESGQ